MHVLFNTQLKRALLGAVCGSLLCYQGVASAAPEVEPNDTKDQAQALEFASPATVSAMLGSGSGVYTSDIDIYYFDGKAGDVPVITLSTAGDWNAVLYLYDSAGYPLVANDDAIPPTEGSVCITNTSLPCDPRIDNRPLDADGRYYVAVAPALRFLFTNMEVHPSFLAEQPGGAYQLKVSGITLPATGGTDTGGTDTGGGDDTTDTGDSGSGDDAMSVMITTLNPDEDDPLLGTYKGKKTIPVAIHSSLPDFDAMEDVDQNSLTFGATGDEKSLLKCKKKGKKVKARGIKDHDKDLVCYFRPDVASLEMGEMSATLKGKTKDGKTITGSGMLRVMTLMTEETETWYKRHDLDPRTVKAKKVKHEKKVKHKKGKKDKKRDK